MGLAFRWDEKAVVQSILPVTKVTGCREVWAPGRFANLSMAQSCAVVQSVVLFGNSGSMVVIGSSAITKGVWASQGPVAKWVVGQCPLFSRLGVRSPITPSLSY